MSSYNGPVYLAPAGTTGNNTSTASHVDPNHFALVFQFVVEAVGATPTVTFKFQGSPDNTNWYDIGYITDGTDGISQSTRTVTAVGSSIAFLSNPFARRYRYVRCVTTANTNVTYRAELYQVN